MRHEPERQGSVRQMQERRADLAPTAVPSDSKRDNSRVSRLHSSASRVTADHPMIKHQHPIGKGNSLLIMRYH